MPWICALEVRDRVDEPAALARQLLGDRLAGDPRHLHQEFVGRGHADRVIEGEHFLAMRRDQRQRLFGAILLHRDRRLGVDRIGRFFKRGAAVIHAELAVGRRVQHVAVVGENGVLDAHQVEDALDLADVADRVAVKAADEIDLLVGLALELVGAVPALPSQKCSMIPFSALS